MQYFYQKILFSSTVYPLKTYIFLFIFFIILKETDDFEYYPSKSVSEEQEIQFIEDIGVFEEGTEML